LLFAVYFSAVAATLASKDENISSKNRPNPNRGQTQPMCDCNGHLLHSYTGRWRRRRPMT